jgi:hypothetical protein
MHQDHCPVGLCYRHVSYGSRPTSWCGRAPEPPRAQWLSAPGRARAFPRRLTSGPSWPHQVHGAGSTLNAYVIGHTQCMAGVKCVQDINAAGRRQYGVDLPDIHSGQATMRGDLMPWCSKATTVPGDPSTQTISRIGAMWRSDVVKLINL